MGQEAMEFDDRVLRRLKLSDLRLLQAVVQFGGMGKAAARLNISQPAVSKAVATLEHTLGVRLLDRGPQGITATRYGQALLEGGAVIFDELRQRVKEIEFLADPTAGELRVGSNSAQMAGMMGAFIKRILARYPRISFHVTEAETFTLLHQQLRARDIDLVLGRVPAGFAEEDMEAHILAEERLAIVAGAQSHWARRRRLDLGDLAGASWVLPPYSSVVGALIAAAFRAAGAQVPRPSVATLSIQLTNNLLMTGPFLGILPGSMLRFGGKSLGLKALPVEFPARPRSLAIITLKNRTLSPVARLFIDCARESAAPFA
jgi:DNA-binding transcriptional LysR family regulator